MASPRAAFSSKYEIPGLAKYGEAFARSKVMEQLIPRQITSAESFQASYPTLLE